MAKTEELDTRLAPGFLVAAPTLADPNFAGSLVLMADHQPEGSLGFIVNRPAPVGIGDILAEVDKDLWRDAQAAASTGASVLLGGPVQPERLWVMYRPADLPNGGADLDGEESVIQLGRDLAVGGSRHLLESVVRAGGSGFHLVLGYAGWGPLQVEREVAAGAWLPLLLQKDLVFEVPFAERWNEAVKRLGLTPGEFAMGGGGAQA